MAYDFPASPTVGQTYTSGGVTFIWNGYAWDKIGSAFPPGTAMLFQQTTAPSGWTKQTTHNDKALRVVNGTVGSGGVQAFSTVFGRITTDAFTLSTNEMPAHVHGINDPTHAHSLSDPGHAHGVYDPSHSHTISPGYTNQVYWYYPGGTMAGSADGSPMLPTSLSADANYTGIGIYGAGTGMGVYGAGTGVYNAYTGASGPHSHGLDIRVLYVDVIIATKD